MNSKIDKQVMKFGYNVVATIRDAKTKEILRTYTYHNIIPTAGRTAIASFLTNASPSPSSLRVNYAALGTGTNVPANTDTTLQTETYRNAIASETNSSNVAYLTAFYSATETSGTYREAGLFMSATGTANSGTLLSRVAINITKSSSETLTLDWTITIS